MAETLDMTLDDIIKNTRRPTPRPAAAAARAAADLPLAAAAAGWGCWWWRRRRRGADEAALQEVGEQGGALPAAQGGSGGGGRVSAIETGTKLYISNLDFGVSTEDIKELFSELGDLKKYVIHYDRSGRSKGTAEVVFARRGDAVAAVKKYNNVQLDGKPMKIEILGTNTPTAAAALPANNGGYVRNVAKSAPRGGPAGLPQGRPRPRGGGRRRGGGGGSGGPGGSGGRRGKERSQPKSAEELDADLEKYHADAMQTN
uniref:RRM domain-containing protein n=1 Tax=Oryza barthii TaxID=65489 RepID=A0A0D3FGW2_9ORYZ